MTLPPTAPTAEELFIYLTTGEAGEHRYTPREMMIRGAIQRADEERARRVKVLDALPSHVYPKTNPVCFTDEGDGVVSAASRDGDTYWYVVIGGKITPEVFLSESMALLGYLAAKHNNGRTRAAYPASAVIASGGEFDARL